MIRRLIILLLIVGCGDDAPTEQSTYTSCVKSATTDDGMLYFVCYSQWVQTECAYVKQDEEHNENSENNNDQTWMWFSDISCSEFCNQTEHPCAQTSDDFPNP